MEKTISEHIEITPGICSGKPCIAGTRIRVWDIHIWHDLRGMSPESIVAEFPQFSLADVHAGIAYFLDHREEMEHQMRADEEFVARLESEQGPTRFTRLRDQIRKNKAETDNKPPRSLGQK